MNRTALARALRRRMTDAEDLLWTRLRRNSLGFKFRRQVPLGRFIVDFVCLREKLIIEVDGGQHLGNRQDHQRADSLQLAGYRVIRFWNHEVLTNPNGVVEVILAALRKSPLPNPPPR